MRGFVLPSFTVVALVALVAIAFSCNSLNFRCRSCIIASSSGSEFGLTDIEFGVSVFCVGFGFICAFFMVF